MRNPFNALAKATRLAWAGKPLSAGLVLQRLIAPPAASVRKATSGTRVAKLRPARVAAPAAPTRPKPGTFIEERFTSPGGSVSYLLYTPVGSARRRLPLVVMLHGCGQTGSDFARGTGMNVIGDEQGFLVLYPEQAVTANFARCWNWNRPSDQRRGRGEPAMLAALTRHIVARCKADPSRVYAAGISAGGSAAAVLCAAYPDVFAAVGVHSGVASGSASGVAEALSVMRSGSVAQRQNPSIVTPVVPTIVFHGDNDATVHPANADEFRQQLARSTDAPLTRREGHRSSPGRRAYTRTTYKAGSAQVMLENWVVHGSGHAWSGGHPAGSYTDPTGPDASRAMAAFFLARRRRKVAATKTAASKIEPGPVKVKIS